MLNISLVKQKFTSEKIIAWQWEKSLVKKFIAKKKFREIDFCYLEIKVLITHDEQFYL